MPPSANSNPSVRENALLSAWNEGRTTLNGWLAIPDASTAEAMAHCGFDSLTIDMQHGLVDYRDAVSMLRAISTTDTVPMVRVPWLDEAIVMKMLDAGAYGIICPMVNTAAQATRLVRACRYPPQGDRSYGPVRASLYAGADYAANANRLIPVFAMIETQEAIANLDDILAVPELTGLFIGPSDLSLAHGETPRLDPEGSRADTAMIDIIHRTRDAGKRIGVFCGGVAYAKRMAAEGADFVSVSSDMRLLSGAGKAVVEDYREC